MSFKLKKLGIKGKEEAGQENNKRQVKTFFEFGIDDAVLFGYEIKFKFGIKK